MATYSPLINFWSPIVDLNGDPMSGGTIECYREGTSTAQNLYDEDGTSLGNTITLNSRGLPSSGNNFVALFRDDAVPIKLLLKNSAGTTVYTFDKIPAVGTFNYDDAIKLDGIEEEADVTDATNVGAVVNGKQSKWIPVGLMYPAVTNGCSALTSAETTAGRPVMRVLDFDSASTEYAQFTYALPERWNQGTVTFRAYWTHASGNTAGLDGVCWGLKAVACGADDTIDVAFGSVVKVGVDSAQSAEDVWVTAESGAVTIAGSPGATELVFFEVSRETDSTSPLDDLDVDARLLGLKLYWTSNALNDA